MDNVSQVHYSAPFTPNNSALENGSAFGVPPFTANNSALENESAFGFPPFKFSIDF